MSDHFVEEELGALLLQEIEDVTSDGIKICRRLREQA
jgi:hypothetical protein